MLGCCALGDECVCSRERMKTTFGKKGVDTECIIPYRIIRIIFFRCFSFIQTHKNVFIILINLQFYERKEKRTCYS